jgi:hypothetical protein
MRSATAFERIAGASAFVVAALVVVYSALFVAIGEGAGRTTIDLWSAAGRRGAD